MIDFIRQAKRIRHRSTLRWHKKPSPRCRSTLPKREGDAREWRQSLPDDPSVAPQTYPADGGDQDDGVNRDHDRPEHAFSIAELLVHPKQRDSQSPGCQEQHRQDRSPILNQVFKRGWRHATARNSVTSWVLFVGYRGRGQLSIDGGIIPVIVVRWLHGEFSCALEPASSRRCWAFATSGAAF